MSLLFARTTIASISTTLLSFSCSNHAINRRLWWSNPCCWWWSKANNIVTNRYGEFNRLSYVSSYRIFYGIVLIDSIEDYHVSFPAHTNAVLTLKWSNDDTTLVRSNGGILSLCLLLTTFCLLVEWISRWEGQIMGYWDKNMRCNIYGSFIKLTVTWLASNQS